MVRSGLEIFCDSPPAMAREKRLGLLCNQASVDQSFAHAAHRFEQSMPGRLSCLFSPQHGFFSEKQDNMVESDHGIDPVTGCPVFSLYGATRQPTDEMLDQCDILVVDLQDVGTRVYTFLWTMLLAIEAAAARAMPVVVLDRPNPLGGDMLEGNLLAPDLFSFVGLHPIPMRHGLTMGELARLFVRERAIDCDLTVVAMTGWHRKMLFHDTGLPWVFPSPNMPTPDTALVYPGQVIWEGTNISEGRGTTRPFEIFGAPFLDPATLLSLLPEELLAGCVLRPLSFQPAFQKWTGTVCHGFQIHVTDPPAFRPFALSLSLLQIIARRRPDDFFCTDPPYEYQYDKQPLDLIIGNSAVVRELLDGCPALELERSWKKELEEFADRRRDILLYT